jgi:hypothetical protein
MRVRKNLDWNVTKRSGNCQQTVNIKRVPTTDYCMGAPTAQPRVLHSLFSALKSHRERAGLHSIVLIEGCLVRDRVALRARDHQDTRVVILQNASLAPGCTIFLSPHFISIVPDFFTRWR